MRGEQLCCIQFTSITCLLSGLLWCALVTDQKSDLSIFPVPGLPLFVLSSLDPNHSIIWFLDFVVTEWDWCAIEFLIQGLFVTILSIKLLLWNYVIQLYLWIDLNLSNWLIEWIELILELLEFLTNSAKRVWLSCFCGTILLLLFGVNSPFKSTQRNWIIGLF